GGRPEQQTLPPVPSVRAAGACFRARRRPQTLAFFGEPSARQERLPCSASFGAQWGVGRSGCGATTAVAFVGAQWAGQSDCRAPLLSERSGGRSERLQRAAAPDASSKRRGSARATAALRFFR